MAHVRTSRDKLQGAYDCMKEEYERVTSESELQHAAAATADAQLCSANKQIQELTEQLRQVRRRLFEIMSVSDRIRGLRQYESVHTEPAEQQRDTGIGEQGHEN